MKCSKFIFIQTNYRRKKWIDNCGNPEIAQLSDRQLRGRRICSDHFDKSAFANPTTTDSLTEKAVPVLFEEGKVSPGQKKDIEATAGDESESPPKKRGRPPRKSGNVVPAVVKGEEAQIGASEAESGDEVEEKPKAKGQDKTPVKAEPGEQTPVKRGPGRPPRKISVSAAQSVDVKVLPKDESEAPESKSLK